MNRDVPKLVQQPFHEELTRDVPAVRARDVIEWGVEYNTY